MISITRNHNKSAREIKDTVDALQKDLSKFKIKGVWRTSDEFVYDAKSGPASGISGTIVFTDTTITLNLDLPFKLKFFSKVIKGEIEKAFDANLLKQHRN